MRKKVWINQGDIVLVSLRDFQDQKGDIILKYYAEEARKLKMYGELPDNARINEGAGDFGEDDDTKQSVVFGTSSTATALEADLEGDGKQKTSDILAELLGDSGSVRDPPAAAMCVVCARVPQVCLLYLFFLTLPTSTPLPWPRRTRGPTLTTMTWTPCKAAQARLAHGHNSTHSGAFCPTRVTARAVMSAAV